ncbi:hypothetical protein SCH01S_35_00340 [Sphingomonas changbaiensis NBRC 104936]|uniref:Lipoprotein n=1 Tax=Sphingomonas changbaiensis NBRC 104936 TaxID=1219043 RepID=A0A0E9MPX6_9SPHN|nr:hypothetical protein [Sphingomonas changbaiensis]GAO39599.1 hypothetical protein SCH01S_35_00340 [Sphingomonas changbaiensis NBRC 104936]
MMRPWPVVALALVACGNGQADRPPATEVIVQQFMASPQPPAPTAELAAQLKFLDECTVKLIRESDITYDTPQDAITQKILGFMNQCSDENDRRLKSK